MSTLNQLQILLHAKKHIQIEKCKQHESIKRICLKREVNEVKLHEWTVVTSHMERHLKVYLIKLNDTESCPKIHS